MLSNVTYEVWLADQFGQRIALISNYERLKWSRKLNGVGQMEMRIAPEAFYRDLWWGKDRRIEVWRGTDGGTLKLIRVYLLRYIEQRMRRNEEYITLKGVDANFLLSNRIVAYDADQSETNKSGNVDDMMKELVDENLGSSATDSDRDIETAGYISIQADLSAVTSDDWQGARANLGRVLEELADTATQQGTRLYYEMVDVFDSNQKGTFQFRTFTDHRGQDRTWPDGANPVILSAEMGNIIDPRLVEDWRKEITVVYAAGQGVCDDRDVQEVEDATRSSESIFSRREALFSATYIQKNDTTALADAGRGRLEQLRPIRNFSAQLVDMPGFRFQRDWDFGDRLTAEYAGQRLDVDVLAVKGDLRANGYEYIEGDLSYAE